MVSVSANRYNHDEITHFQEKQKKKKKVGYIFMLWLVSFNPTTLISSDMSKAKCLLLLGGKSGTYKIMNEVDCSFLIKQEQNKFFFFSSREKKIFFFSPPLAIKNASYKKNASAFFFPYHFLLYFFILTIHMN
ncbi:hypothetical protein BDF20DRAFT_98171 [Mycotypha africana]|uniref:uncharacterized protein n=1 Tax=Mycotypha africana TaxID=64632 RepID=UPI002300548C|nr:uncharacterized protein BDF20DRAFT_98171 [Mycotypha africana]KAI8969997.1 hypothetical protein BDF20DRAFT_98171 [Mycotypha africana]